MDIKKIVVVLIALVAGGGAFYLTLTNQNNNEPAPVPVIQATKEKTVGVLVASVPLDRGAKLNIDAVEWKDWPEKVIGVDSAFITDQQADAIEKLEGAIAKTSFVPGEPLVESKIVRAGANGVLAAVMTPGMRALALRVTPETASGGFILPGDRVDIINAVSAGRGEPTIATTIFRDIRVLAVNEVYTENPETAVIDGVNITMEFEPAQAEAFIAARTEGKLSLSLRSIREDDDQTAESTSNRKKQKSKDRTTKKVSVIRIGRS
ncbi:MAG: Flp pilus assembly protein CpaB [Pseudomonadota bacterium]